MYEKYVRYYDEFDGMCAGWYYLDEAGNWQGPYTTKEQAEERFDR